MADNPMEAKFLSRLNRLFDRDPRTDTAISDALGVSKQTVSYWRSGRRSPKRSMIYKIAEMYGVSPIWLMGFDEEEGPEEERSVMVELSTQELRLLCAWRGAELTYQTVAMELLESHQKREG